MNFAELSGHKIKDCKYYKNFGRNSENIYGLIYIFLISRNIFAFKLLIVLQRPSHLFFKEVKRKPERNVKILLGRSSVTLLERC